MKESIIAISLAFYFFSCKPILIQVTKQEKAVTQTDQLVKVKLADTEKPSLISEKFNEDIKMINNDLQSKVTSGSEEICYNKSNSTENVLEMNAYMVKHDANFPMRLGYGISLKNLQAAYVPAISYTTDTIEGKGSSQTRFEAKLINSYSELKTFLEIDYKAEVSAFGLGGASLSANFKRDFKFSENSLYFVVKGSTEYGRIGLKNIQLTEEAINVYNANPEEFVNKYGFAFPIVENHGAKIYLLFKLNTTDESLKQSLSSSVSGNISLGIFSASTDVSVRSTIDKVLKTKNYELTVFSEGSESFKGIDNLLNSLKGNTIDIDAVITNTASYLNTFTFTTSAPIQYNLMYYRQLGLSKLPLEDDYIKRYSFLQNLLDIYNTNKEQLKKFEFLFNNESLLKSFFSNNTSELDALREDRKTLIQTQQLLYANFDLFKHQNTISSKTCIKMPKGFAPYTFSASKFFKFDLNNFKASSITGKYLEDLSLHFEIFVPGSGNVILNETFNFRGGDHYGSSRTNTGNPNEDVVSFDSERVITEFYTNKVRSVIRAGTAPAGGVDDIIYKYFHPGRTLNTGKLLKGFAYIRANNIAGFEDEKLIAKISFDGINISIIPINN